MSDRTSASLSELRSKLKEVFAKHKVRLKKVPSTGELGDFLATAFEAMLEIPGGAARLRRVIRETYKELADAPEEEEGKEEPAKGAQPPPVPAGPTMTASAEKVLRRFIGRR